MGTDNQPPGGAQPPANDTALVRAESTALATGDLPVAMYSGTLPFGDMELECHVLPGGLAVITTTAIGRFLFGVKDGHLRRFLDRIANGSALLTSGAEVQFRVPGVGPICRGYETDFVIAACDLYLDALIEGTLHAKQRPAAARARIILRSCSKVGLAGLVFEATGYAKHAGANLLQNKLVALLREEAGVWSRMFDLEFYLELAKLYRLELTSTNRRPGCFGAFLAEFMYDGFDTEVAAAIRQRNQRDVVPHKKHHQFFTDEGRTRFEAHKRDVLMLMRSSTDIGDFRMRFNHLHYGTGLQLALGGAR